MISFSVLLNKTNLALLSLFPSSTLLVSFAIGVNPVPAASIVRLEGIEPGSSLKLPVWLLTGMVSPGKINYLFIIYLLIRGIRCLSIPILSSFIFGVMAPSLYVFIRKWSSRSFSLSSSRSELKVALN